MNLVVPELDNLSCHAQFSATGIITMPIIASVIRYSVILHPAISEGARTSFGLILGMLNLLGKPHGVVSDDQPEAREGQAGRPSERPRTESCVASGRKVLSLLNS
jgi:hypothetical protein